ncbi:lipopolysaccharide-induced tumor necrosis factor-alpha factor homolog [Drosophila mojavensis]|uniref:LITAF domain-containing protein n=1 Tax=Drosophila mojavensis TaxID=7230 RepID=B4KP86_DROMO|nr:lipopolysaccharide-induced tumor necrosis factor-alpha factor homolog [Drosophila mojavensis]AJC97623.1 hypothetical protein [Drosophila mojavensis]AJC97624.1 hypothetical protein [Drosophila mojavensis]AJC97626.1 hypothetical protein [Drosophila mojavensis]EDW09062.1 uncharacterized protein Dmoj_GI20303 [Drosophila mojavensis]
MSTPVGPEPSSLICPNCHQQVTTRTEPKATTKTHLLALILSALCLWPCAIALYCTKCARSTDHFCPSCNNYVGTYVR